MYGIAVIAIFPAVYLLATAISRAWFSAKFDYHKRLMRQVDKELNDG